MLYSVLPNPKDPIESLNCLYGYADILFENIKSIVFENKKLYEICVNE